MKSLTCFSSRSRGTCCAVILERLAENCRGRTTAIICTRTNAPKYILESHRLHFGSICDQNGRNFEPWFQYISVWSFIIKLACESQLTEILFKLLIKLACESQLTEILFKLIIIIIINLLRLNLQEL